MLFCPINSEEKKSTASVSKEAHKSANNQSLKIIRLVVKEQSLGSLTKVSYWHFRKNSEICVSFWKKKGRKRRLGCGPLLYLVVVCSISKEATKGDGIGDATQVDEEHSWDGLDVEPLIEITWQPWQFPLYVQVQTTTEAVTQQHRQLQG